MAYSTAILLLIFSLTSALQDQQEMKAKPGDDVTLQCQSLRDGNISMFHWSRPELKSESYVYFFRGSRSYEHYQHPSVRGRVQLRDASSMKDGDVSVILKNVTVDDAGTYECRVAVKDKRSELRNTIILKVEDSGDTAAQLVHTAAQAGDTAGNITDEGKMEEVKQDEGKKDRSDPTMVACLSGLGVLLIICAVAFVIFRKRKNMKGYSSQSPPEKEIEPLQV